MEKDDLIEFIVKYSSASSRPELEEMTLESLVMIKVQLELELKQKFCN
jgi:hypothetical protein